LSRVENALAFEAVLELRARSTLIISFSRFGIFFGFIFFIKKKTPFYKKIE
jgi:hypothetical protein